MGAAQNLEIRPYETGDHEAVIALWARVFPEEPSWNQADAVIRRKLGVQRELFLLALHGDRVVGTVLAGFDGVRGWVHKVGVDPSQRRRGVAAALMAAAEAGLAARGCTKLNLQVRAGNDAAVRFYEALGYGIEPRVSMGRHLAAPEAC